MTNDRTFDVVIGSLESEHVVLRPSPVDSEGWSRTTVDVTVRGFSGRVVGDILLDELMTFRDALHTLDRSLLGEAELAPLEGWLRIRFRVNRLGHCSVDVEVRQETGIGHPFYNTLNCMLPNVDQTQLAGIVRALDKAIAKTK
ncbi:MAG TPA: hypothetical protein VGM90_12840 [Kofleriaceae bacterium]|jgi:hypothetical protein